MSQEQPRLKNRGHITAFTSGPPRLSADARRVRANLTSWNKPKGTLSWTVSIEELVDLYIERLVLGIQDVHGQDHSLREFVGRKSIAWRMSYNTVLLGHYAGEDVVLL